MDLYNLNLQVIWNKIEEIKASIAESIFTVETKEDIDKIISDLSHLSVTLNSFNIDIILNIKELKKNLNIE